MDQQPAIHGPVSAARRGRSRWGVVTRAVTYSAPEAREGVEGFL